MSTEITEGMQKQIAEAIAADPTDNVVELADGMKVVRKDSPEAESYTRQAGRILSEITVGQVAYYVCV